MLHCPAQPIVKQLSTRDTSVRTCWLINGSRALDHLAGYASDPRPEVQDELVAGWSYFDPGEYARRVLVDAPLNKGRLTIEDTNLLPALPMLRNLRDLRVKLPDDARLDCLHGLPALTELQAEKVLSADLPELTEHSSLRRVDIVMENYIDDISPFLMLPRLRELQIVAKQFRSGLSFIRRLPKLKSLMLTGLTEVEDFTPLDSQELIETLYLHDCKNLRSLDEIRSLPKLRSLRACLRT